MGVPPEDPEKTWPSSSGPTQPRYTVDLKNPGGGGGREGKW